MISTILIVLAFICLLMAAIGKPVITNVNMGWLGVALWCLSAILRRV